MIPNTPDPGSFQSQESSLPIGEYACMIGLDWGDSKHAITLWARNSLVVEKLQVDARPESVHQWLENLTQRFDRQPIAIALEASRGPIVEIALQYPTITLYPVHPATSRRFSKAFAPSGAANDQPDADNLLEIVRFHRHKLRALLIHDSATRRLNSLVALRRKIVDERTRLSNEMTSLLKGYFPQALDLIGYQRHSSLALDFLSRWPDLASLKKARPQTVRAFFHQHHVRRPELISKRLDRIENARILSVDPVLVETSVVQLRCLIAQCRSLEPHLQAIEEKIEQLFEQHDDRAIFKSFPAAGAAMAPRLCVLFGVDRARWQNASQLQKYYGVAPVIEASGRQRWTHWRWNAPTFARQTLVEWAGITVRSCPWAKAYYEKHKAAGKSHAAILRGLAFKWLRILFRCWKTKTPYDDELYLRWLKLKGSDLPDRVARKASKTEKPA